MNIRQVGLKDIKEYEKNPRKNADAVDKVAASIQAFGFKQPIVVDGEGVIIAGHTRYKAAMKLGLQTVPVLYATDLSAEQVKAYRLADNKTAEFAEWDLGLMGEELKDLAEAAFDMTQFGFEEWVTGESEEDDFDVDAALADIKEPVSKLGDIWCVGRHRVACGDSTSRVMVRALMGENAAQMAFTDPPWNVDYGANNNPNRETSPGRQILNDAMSREQFAAFLKSAFTTMHGVCNPGCMVYVVMSSKEWGTLMHVMAETGYHWSSTIIWAKDTLVLSRKDYHSQYEPIWYGWKDGARIRPLKDREQSDLWAIPRPKRSEAHPTMKPVELMVRAIQNSSKPGDIVLDLFGGSGSTLIAAEKTKRTCYMMELDPKYVDVIIRRWETSTGGKAVRICKEENHTRIL